MMMCGLQRASSRSCARVRIVARGGGPARPPPCATAAGSVRRAVPDSGISPGTRRRPPLCPGEGRCRGGSCWATPRRVYPRVDVRQTNGEPTIDVSGGGPGMCTDAATPLENAVVSRGVGLGSAPPRAGSRRARRSTRPQLRCHRCPDAWLGNATHMGVGRAPGARQRLHVGSGEERRCLAAHAGGAPRSR
jgi:hypothetical protein